MAKHNLLGKKGEEMAVGFLKKKGFVIIAQNWRHQHLEIDIIATKGDTLHFIEVKTRKNTTFGYPEEAVTDKKLNRLILAATEFQYQHPKWNLIQFDILSIQISDHNTAEFFFIEDIDLPSDL